MRLNDRARDRQTHTHTVRLGGKEGIENAREFVNGNAAAGIAHSDLDGLRSAAQRGYADAPVLPVCLIERI